MLSELVEKFGPRNWSSMARSIPGRSGKSCRLRWCNQLDPSLKRNPFTGIDYSSLILIFQFDLIVHVIIYAFLRFESSSLVNW